VPKPKIAVIGAGKVGSALALLLNRQGYPVAGVASKDIESAQRVADELKVPATVKPEEVTIGADIVFITTLTPTLIVCCGRRDQQAGRL